MFFSVDEQIKLDFLCTQLKLISRSPHSRRYDYKLLSTIIPIFLSSRSSYQKLNEVLAIPSKITLMKHFCGVSEAGSESDAKNLIKDLIPFQNRNVILLFDEIYILPSIRFRASHLIGYSHDAPSEPARTLLFIMVKPLMGGSSFVVRIIPIYKLSSELLSSCLYQV